MSIALESSSNRIEGSGYIRGISCMSIFESPESGRPIPGKLHGDRRFPAGNPATITTKVEEREDSESCSSSIGRNSDLSGRSSDGDDSGETEVQSSLKGPLDTMDALEEVLPIRRGISKFYCGKSKSFTSLADASSTSSIKDLVKPENAYTRKRKNLLACTNFLDKNRNFPLRSYNGGISKKPTNSNRSTLALAVAMSSSESNNGSDNSNNSNSSSSSPPRLLPPLHPQGRSIINNASPSSPPHHNLSPWRSFSLTDLQGAAYETNATSASVSYRDKNKNVH